MRTPYANFGDNEKAAIDWHVLPRAFTLFTHSLWEALWCWCQGHLVWWMEGFPTSCPPPWSKGCFLHTHCHEPDSFPPVCERTKALVYLAHNPHGLFLNCCVCYQKEHSPGKLLGHFQLPQDINRYWILVFLQIRVQGTKLHIFLHHDVYKKSHKLKYVCGGKSFWSCEQCEHLLSSPHTQIP